jgi:hypothetical protein
MIVVQLSGGVGNQMFQYAMGRALAARHDARLVLDSSRLEGESGNTYELGCFQLEAPLAPWVRIDPRDYQADQPPSTTTFAPVT